MNKEVSIIIPTYNAEKYISDCIESVLSQTYSNIEVIIIDDGSTDKTSVICKEYQKKDERINYYFQNNSGVSKARNFGIELAEGKYIVFIDADDMISCTYIEQLVYIFDNENIQMASVSHTRDLSNLGKDIYKQIAVVDSEEVRSFMMDFTQQKFNGYVWEKMFVTDIVKNSVRYNEAISVREDLLFIIQYLKYIDKCGYINNNLYYYRDNDSSVLHNMSANRMKTQIMMAQIVLETEQKDSKLYYDAMDSYYESGRRYVEILSREKILTKDVKKKWLSLQIRHFKDNKSVNQIKRIVACLIQKCC